CAASSSTARTWPTSTPTPRGRAACSATSRAPEPYRGFAISARFRFSPRRLFCSDPARRRQRYPCPRDKLVGLVEQPLGRAPEREVDRSSLCRIMERREGSGLLELRPVVVVDPEVECVVGDHPEHHAAAKHAGLAEYAPHRDPAERREL